MRNKMLIVEDDLKISRILELQLNHAGYMTKSVHNGEDALIEIEGASYDLILLDIMIPKINGLELCRRIRETLNTPIIMLTAKDDITDKVIGLDLGANDYITKPFEMEELLARVRVQIRNNDNKQKEDKLVINELEINKSSYEVYRFEQQINLSKTEFDLLEYLAENKGVVLKREKIINKIWGYDYYGNDNILDVYIKYLRDKLEKPFNKGLIETVRGVGYTIR